MIFLASTQLAFASRSDLTVEVRDADARPLDEVVVYAVPRETSLSPPKGEAIMDQRNRMFVPHVLPIQTGTAVKFPNSDNVRHQVYSFSSPKKFQIPLYEGTPAEAIVFDKPGVLTLGCNIHDRMSAFIVVVDTPYFGVTEDGRVELKNLDAGSYDVYVWHAGLRHEPSPQRVTLGEAEHRDLVYTTRKK
ncbi:MAG TPA: methylamine utilization protein [Vicinamibacteria bacterium]|nr:methylamine utilization protein [Vicinamibacteria bacterium]